MHKKRAGTVNMSSGPYRQNLNFGTVLHSMAAKVMHDKNPTKKGVPPVHSAGGRIYFNGMAAKRKLTDEQVRELRRQYESTHYKANLVRAWAAETGCSVGYLYQVADGGLRGDVF